MFMSTWLSEDTVYMIQIHDSKIMPSHRHSICVLIFFNKHKYVSAFSDAQIIWAACMTHMDETIFPDPSKFDPTRFEQQKPAPYGLVAFGGGPRMCPGNEFTRIETLTMIHHLVTLFTWKLSSKDNPFSRDPLPVFKEGLPIQIEPKK